MPLLTISALTEAAENAIAVGALYSVGKRGELFYDAILFSILKERHGPLLRQWKLPRLRSQAQATRIDFKERHKNGAVIEFAVRAQTGAELLSSQNKPELKKLLRARSARIRFLLLMDPSKRAPYDFKTLQSNYKAINLGRGRRHPLPVRVIYARPGHSFDFLWRR